MEVKKEDESTGLMFIFILGLFSVLSQVYPQFDWDGTSFSHKRKTKRQKMLGMALQNIYSTSMILEEHRVEHNGDVFRFDAFIPRFSLAIEFQGKGHEVNFEGNNLRPLTKNRDKKKSSFCSSSGITLIQIPSSWDGTTDHLLSFITQNKSNPTTT